MRKYIIKIGSSNPNKCHTEMETNSLQEAIALMHALIRKGKPEKAVANFGDFGAWECNASFAQYSLSGHPLHYRVCELIKKFDKEDEEAEVDNCLWIPDIKISPTKEGYANVESIGMQFDSICRAEDIPGLVKSLIEEYQCLVSAGEVSNPGRTTSRRSDSRVPCHSEFKLTTNASRETVVAVNTEITEQF